MKSKSEQDCYYFFMKVGFGNCFLKYAQDLGGLWVGYDGDKIPELSSGGLCEKGTEQADLRYMAVASSERLRDRIRIVSYSKDNLLIFQPTASLEYLGQNRSIDWSDPNLYSSFPRDWRSNVEKKFGKIGNESFLSYVLGDSGWKFIPAKLVASIPRANLIAPIDSLSVWQSFNRRTFQPMFSLGGGEPYKSLTWLRDISHLDPLRISKDETLNEGLFGKMIRTYLDIKVGSQDQSIFVNLPSSEVLKTAFAMLNPAQVETAAMYICSDLGFTADVGRGKGLDVADVKGTVRHLNEMARTKRVDTAIEKLSRLGVKFSEKLRTSIQATSTIRFQCKARKNNISDLGTVLLVEPGLNSTREDCLALESLAEADKNEFPGFHQWLDVLSFDLRNAHQV